MKTDEQINREVEFIINLCQNQLWVSYMLAGYEDCEETAMIVTEFVKNLAVDGGPKEALVSTANEVLRLLKP